MKIEYTLRLKKIEEILQEMLPSEFSNEWNKNVFGMLPEAVNSEHIGSLTSPCRNLLLLGGKRWRPLFLVLCAEMVQNNTDSTLPYQLTPLVEFVHTASLIHDDIEDSADTRRGQPATHITYGLDTAINAGSWLYFQAFGAISKLPLKAELKNLLFETTATELRRLHLGQAMDIEWHNHNTKVPSSQEYLAMVRMKTGTLASLAGKIGIIGGGGTKDQADRLGIIAADIGVGFQILDDIINLTTGNVGKKRGDDIVEGKKSLPILLHLQENPNDFDIIMSCFSRARKEGIESPAVEECILLIEKGNALSKAKNMASSLITQSCNEIVNTYGDNEYTKRITTLFTNMLS
jgi:octaprenyl-diphosphate synthase